jgi:hypothetical protein
MARTPTIIFLVLDPDSVSVRKIQANNSVSKKKTIITMTIDDNEMLHLFIVLDNMDSSIVYIEAINLEDNIINVQQEYIMKTLLRYLGVYFSDKTFNISGSVLSNRPILRNMFRSVQFLQEFSNVQYIKYSHDVIIRPC